jgi:hypothetical protein
MHIIASIFLGNQKRYRAFQIGLPLKEVICQWFIGKGEVVPML